MGKKLLVLGGGENQVPIIQKAKQLGHHVVLCDYLPDNPGRLYSDIHYLASTYEYEDVLKVAKKEKIDGVVTNSEPVLHVMARLTDELKLPSVTEKTVALFLDKNRMRNHLEKCGFNTVRYRSCEELEDAIGFFRSVKCKMIMKPADSSASRGVFSINNEDDIRKYFKVSQNANRRSRDVQLEEYIEGYEFSVDGICIDGKHYSLGVSRKKQYSYNENLDKELYFSYYDSDFDYDALREYNDEIAESTGLPFGMTHAEYKYSNGRFHFIEMAARGGGMFISTMIIPFISGVDTVKILIESSLGEQVTESIEVNDQFKNRCGVLKFLSPPNEQSGIVRCIDGVDVLKQKGIVKYSFDCKVGDYVKHADDGTNRLGYYIAVGETKRELDKIMRSVDENIVIGF